MINSLIDLLILGTLHNAINVSNILLHEIIILD